jgi:Tol biopolymer transport system component
VINSKGEVLGDSLWISGIEEQNNRRLAFIEGDNRYPRFSKKNEFLFTSQHPGDYPQIWMMNLSSLEKKQLTKNGGWAADWSPDGEWIVYTETYDTGRLWLMRPDGSEQQQLTFE